MNDTRGKEKLRGRQIFGQSNWKNRVNIHCGWESSVRKCEGEGRDQNLVLSIYVKCEWLIRYSDGQLDVQIQGENINLASCQYIGGIWSHKTRCH